MIYFYFYDLKVILLNIYYIKKTIIFGLQPHVYIYCVAFSLVTVSLIHKDDKQYNDSINAFFIT